MSLHPPKITIKKVYWVSVHVISKEWIKKVLLLEVYTCPYFNGAGGIVLEKRKRSPLPPDFNHS
jgi:hypothetical protein